MTHATRRLVMLARAPAHGRAKTRLAADVGAGAACRLARAMLADCWAAAGAVRDARTELRLALCDAPGAYPLLTPPALRPLPQGEGDLGARMGRLAHAGAREGHATLLLGTDAPGLSPELLNAALQALDQHDLVLGPVPDGGFWCLGLAPRAAQRLQPDWLDGLDWERDGTRAQVQARAAQLGLSLTLAPPWFDVDRGPDLERLARHLALHPDAAPRCAELLAGAIERSPPSPMLLSVIVATLNEGQRLNACLDALARQPGPVEVIVSDGGSDDEGPERAAARGHVVLRGPSGRGAQLAAGAQHASGEALLFLHVDTSLPEGALDRVREALQGGAYASAEAGAFVTHTRRDPALPNPWGPLLRLADLRSRFTRHPYGDQAMFCTRAAYDAVGGMRALPIMEDYDLSVRLAGRRPLARIGTPVIVSGRRMQRRPLRTLLLMRIIPPLYRMGVSPERLARLYRG